MILNMVKIIDLLSSCVRVYALNIDVLIRTEDYFNPIDAINAYVAGYLMKEGVRLLELRL